MLSSTEYVPGYGDGISNSADLNGDGLLDLIAAGAVAQLGDGFSVLLGLRDGGFAVGGFYPVDESSLSGPVILADVNGDGLPDIVYPGLDGVEVMLDDGTSFGDQRPLIATGNMSVVAAVGDLDNDGIADVVVAEVNPDDHLILNAFMGLSDGGFSMPVSLPYDWALGFDYQGLSGILLSDLNQDGFLDIVVAPSGVAVLYVLLHEPDGGYRSTGIGFADGIGATALLPGAPPDLVVNYRTPSHDGTSVVVILQNDGAGNFTTSKTYQLPYLAGSMAVADFNGDCLPDLALSGAGCFYPNPGLSVLPGDSDGGFGPPQPLPLDGGASGALSLLGSASSPRTLAVSLCEANAEVAIYGGSAGH